MQISKAIFSILLLSACETGQQNINQPIDMPGDSRTSTSALLASDTLRAVMFMDSLRDDNCSERRLVDTEFLGISPAHKFRQGVLVEGSWTEVWTIERCGREFEWRVVFNADGKGGTNFHVSENK